MLPDALHTWSACHADMVSHLPQDCICSNEFTSQNVDQLNIVSRATVTLSHAKLSLYSAARGTSNLNESGQHKDVREAWRADGGVRSGFIHMGMLESSSAQSV